MANEKGSDNRSITVTSSENEEPLPLDATPVVIESEEHSRQSRSVSGASTQMQLLHLAKSFALDGGLKASNKQMPLEDRSRKRERLDLIRQQQNMETIIQKALPYCSDDEATNRTDQDWFNRFVELAQGISNNTMQDLWAKILAGEISHPGLYSLKALKIFRNMSMNDAKLLAKACALAVKDHNRKNMRIISGCYQKPGLLNFFDKNREQVVNISHFGLNHSDLLNLADNHLVFISESESGLMAKDDELNFIYNGLPLKFQARKANCILRFYKFTPLGVELAHLINDKPDNAYFKHLQQQLSHHFNS